MKKYNVFTHYDTNGTVIGTIIPKVDKVGRLFITKRTYKKLLSARTIGGDVGIYTDCPFKISVYDPVYDIYIVDI